MLRRNIANSVLLYQRLPYDWKVPLMYVVTILIQGVSLFTLLRLIQCVVFTLIGVSHFLRAFSADIQHHLKEISTEFIHARKPLTTEATLKLKTTVLKIIEFHSRSLK